MGKDEKRLRTPIVAVLGHVDHGKCLTPESLVATPEGLVRIEDFFDSAQPYFRENGCEVRKISTVVQGLSADAKNSVLNSTHVWKLRHRGKVVKIKLKNWHTVTTTPEHPFLTNTGWKKACELRVGDFVAIPKKIVGNERFERFLSYVYSKFGEDAIFRIAEDKLKDITLPSRKAYKVRRNVFRLEEIRELGLFDFIESFAFCSRKQRCGKPRYYLRFPRSVEEWKAVFYLAGVMFGDGIMSKIANNDEDVFERIKRIESLGVEVVRVRRRSSYEIEFRKGKNTLLKFIKTLFDYPERRKSHTIEVPRILFLAPKELVAEFIKGYFDADATVNERSVRIEVSSTSHEFIHKLSLVLLRFEILSKIYRIGKSYNGKMCKYSLLTISGKRNLENYAKYIGFSVKRKVESLKKIVKRSKKSEAYPLQEELKRLRILFGFTKSEIGKIIPFYAKYESCQMPSYEIVKRFLNVLERGCKNLNRKVGVLEGRIKDSNYVKAFVSDGLIDENGNLTDIGREALNIWKNMEFDLNDIKYLENLIENVAFVEVEDVEVMDYDGYVYDLTTPTHNFVANGVIVHNTTLLDKIRKTRVAQKEVGGITQHIGATEIPIDVIKRICKDFLKNVKITIPGLLFIDTPGHQAFTNLRKRGGALADLAVLVVDINEGFKPQTEEAISILKTFRTPFVVCANKIDKIPGWKSVPDAPFLKSYAQQDEYAKRNLENKIYELIGKLYEHGFNADRFDRIRDFTRTVAIVPTSAVTGEGIPELLMVLVGLAQKYLEKSLRLHVEGKAKGTILEVKEEKGLGVTCDAILYDGTLKVGDTIAIAGIDDVIVTKVRAILKPRPVRDIRMESKFTGVKQVTAAAGIKIVAPNLEKVLAGSEFEVVESEEDVKKFRERVRKEYEEIAIRTDEEGVVLKTDTLGSLEALINELKNKGIPIKKAEVGDVDKRDVVEASANKDEVNKVVLAFNVKLLPGVAEEAEKYGVKIFQDSIIYSLVDNYVKWREETKALKEKQRIEALIKPGKIKLLPEFIFRRSKPAIVGIRVLAGELRKDVNLIKPDGTKVGTVRSMQKEKKNVNVAKEGEELAIAIDGVTIGRQLEGDEILYVDVPENHARIIEREFMNILSEKAKEAFKEFLEIKRRQNPLWAK
ncbi:intein-containing translation initiation factor aIF-2 [Archaeoglobus sp.]